MGVALVWLLKLCIEIANWLFFQLLQCIAPGMIFSFFVKFCQISEVMNYYSIDFDGIIGVPCDLLYAVGPQVI